MVTSFCKWENLHKINYRFFQMENLVNANEKQILQNATVVVSSCVNLVNLLVFTSLSNIKWSSACQ